MCDPVLIVAILEELGYFDEEKGTDETREISDKERNKVGFQESGEEDHKQK